MKIAVLFPSFLGGGAEAVCSWILEALKEHDVTLVTLSEVRLEQLDDQYGTSLAGSPVRILTVPMPMPFQMRKRIIDSLSAFSFRQFYLSWYYRRYLARYFNIAISAFNEMDLGGQGIQYIHAPMFGKGHERIRSYLDHPDSILRRIYKWTLRGLFGYSEHRMRSNITLTNSEWTARWVQQIYGIKARVIYPPVSVDICDVPWEERQYGFILISRVVKEKKIERAIRIIQRVRNAGFQVHLRILGGVYDSAYIEDLWREFGKPDWIVWEKRLSREEYIRVLSSYKYGIHTRENEQFGIGIAEMICAGVIPFLPSRGGQVELVGNHPLLTWDNEEEATQKIIKVLSNEDLYKELQLYISNRSKKFSAERFIAQIQKIVEDFGSKKKDL